jgi:hypothetical protein
MPFLTFHKNSGQIFPRRGEAWLHWRVICAGSSGGFRQRHPSA